MKTSLIPDTPSMQHLKNLAKHFNVKYGNMMDLADSRAKMVRPLEFRSDHGQLKASTTRQMEIFQLILDNSHPAPGRNSTVLKECSTVKNLAMKFFLR